MSELLPTEIIELEAFLKNAGLKLQFEEKSAAFGNRLIQFANEQIAVRITSDRGVWFVELSDPLDETGDWYDAALMRDLLSGHGEDVLTLPDQVRFVRDSWKSIVGRFDANNRVLTHARLIELRRERAKRRIPELYI